MPLRSILRAFMLAAFAAVALCAPSVQAAEIKIIAANALKEPLLALIAPFEKASGHTVTPLWGGTEGIAKRIADGEIVDLVVIASPNIDRLIASGKLAAGSRTDFARSGVGIAIRSGLPKPDVSTPEGVKSAVLAAGSIAYSTGPSGFYIVEMLQKMGVSEQVKPKVRQPPSGAQVGELIAKGEADLGFQQVSELLHVKGIDYLGPLPAAIQNTTVYSTGLHVASPAPDAAKALVAYLTGPQAGPVLAKVGLESGQP
jgi:molybdate transport system substrate-binding protein